MNVLFFMRSQVYVRNFESTLRLLAERGHRVSVVADPHERLDHADAIGRLCAAHPGISVVEPPSRDAAPWSRFGLQVRRGIDYLRYFGPEYRDAPKLRRRAELKAPGVASSGWWTRAVATDTGRRLLAFLLRVCDRAVPVDPGAEAFVRAQQPDLVLVTPLVEPGSPQSEYLRAARAVGARTGLCVYSWDNLTNKGLIHDELDVVTVWNEPMKREAVTLHGVPEPRVRVTGAPAYDHWFAWTAQRSRDEFCAQVGLDPARPYLLYLCSSRFIAPDEVPFVRRWIAAIRERSSRLARAGIVIRPHPQNAEQWRTADLRDLDRVAVWPRAGANPVDDESRRDYFDSIYHSAGVIGVNTSAQIESAIVGRGVYTWLVPEFQETQDGTLHFHHLRDAGGGLVHVATSLDEHVAHLEAATDDPQGARARGCRFVEAFVRPHGVAAAATPRLVEALEGLAAQGPANPYRGPWWSALVRPLLRPIAGLFERAERAREAQVAALKLDVRRRKARV